MPCTAAIQRVHIVLKQTGARAPPIATGLSNCSAEGYTGRPNWQDAGCTRSAADLCFPAVACLQESYEGNRAPFPIFIHTPCESGASRGALHAVWQGLARRGRHVCKCRASPMSCAAAPAPPAGLSRGTHQQQLQRFVKEIAQLDDVYFVTMRQLLAWMQVRAARRPCAASFRWPSPCWVCARPRPTVAVNANRVPVRFALRS